MHDLIHGGQAYVSVNKWKDLIKLLEDFYDSYGESWDNWGKAEKHWEKIFDRAGISKKVRNVQQNKRNTSVQKNEERAHGRVQVVQKEAKTAKASRRADDNPEVQQKESSGSESKLESEGKKLQPKPKRNANNSGNRKVVKKKSSV